MQTVRSACRILPEVHSKAKPLLTKVHRTNYGYANLKYSTLVSREGSTCMAENKLTYEGILAPVFTPFPADCEKPALDVIPKYSSYLSSKGINGVLVNGTNGEGMSLTLSERMSVAEAWLDAGHSDKLHVQVQVGGTNMKDILTLAKHAESRGADSLLCLPELYYRPNSVDAIVKYLKLVADAAPSTPILYYNIPSYTNVNLNLTELLIHAGQAIPTFVGMKFTSGDMITGKSIASLDPDRFTIFFGGNEIMTGAYLLGFTSWTASTANMFPILCLEILNTLTHGRFNKARQKQQELNIAIRAISQFGNRIACFKAATELISGVATGPTRFPVQQLDPESMDNLRKTLQEIQAI